MNIRKNEEPVFSDSGTYSRLITPEYCTTAETRDSRTKTYWSRAEKVARSKTGSDQEQKSWEIQDRIGPEQKIWKAWTGSGPTKNLKISGQFPDLAICGSLAETTNESADEGPIETLENPNTLEDAVNLQVQENLKKLRKFYGIECIRNDRRISIRRVFNNHSDWSIHMIDWDSQPESAI